MPDDSPSIGKTLAECAFRSLANITVIAILREPEPISGASPDDVIQLATRWSPSAAPATTPPSAACSAARRRCQMTAARSAK